MSDSAKMGFGLLALLLLIGATYLLVKNNEIKGDIPQGVLYESAMYGYSFMYDAGYELVEFTPEYQTLEDPTRAEPNEIAQIAAETADLTDPSESFEEFAKVRARVYCAADGPGGSLYCTRTTRSQPFTSGTGVEGEIFYLELVSESGEERTTREAGPFYAFNISKDSPGSGYSALIFRPAQFFNESDMYDEGAKVVNDIVNTLRFAE